MPLFLIFLIIPLIEIALFISIGGEIGMLNTLLLCVVTALLGAVLLKAQGLRTFLAARGALQRGQLPIAEIFDGLCLAVAGALLLTPGFFTDAIGFSLMVPALRSVLRQQIAVKMNLRPASGRERREQAAHSDDIIEVDYEIIDHKDTEKD